MNHENEFDPEWALNIFMAPLVRENPLRPTWVERFSELNSEIRKAARDDNKDWSSLFIQDDIRAHLRFKKNPPDRLDKAEIALEEFRSSWRKCGRPPVDQPMCIRTVHKG